MSREGLWRIGAALFLGAYAALLLRANCDVAGGADSSGYLNAARLFARGDTSEPIGLLSDLSLPESDQELFTPLGYRQAARPGRMAPTYAPGLPLHLAAAGSVAGWRVAPFLVVPLLAVASLALLYLIARELGLSRPLSSAAALLLAATPIFFGMAIQPMSDVPATAWGLATIFLGLRARRRPAWAFAAGAAYGVAVLVRPTNVLIGLALFFALPRGTKVVARAAAGALPLAILLLVYNTVTYGHPAETGYSGHTQKMSIGHVPVQARIYGSWLVSLMTPLVPLAWIVVAFDRRAPRRDRWLLLSWFGAFLGFYLFNEILEDWWVTRYLLPGIPALILSAVIVARDLGERLLRDVPRIWKVVAGAVIVLLVVAVGVRKVRRFELLQAHRGEAIYRTASLGTHAALPERSIVVSMQMSGALKFYTGRPILRWERVPADRWPELRSRGEKRGYRWYALLWPFEENDAFRNVPGSWTRVGLWRDIVLWRLD